MGILLFLLFGLVVGLLARALYPGEDEMGLLTMMGLGLAGALAGGFLTSLLLDRSALEIDTAGLLFAIVGALVAVFAGRAVLRRRPA